MKQFQLKSLFWFSTVCAIGAWLLSLPQIPIGMMVNRNPPPSTLDLNISWPVEATIRVAACTIVFFIPILFARVKSGRIAQNNDPVPFSSSPVPKEYSS